MRKAPEGNLDKSLESVEDELVERFRERIREALEGQAEELGELFDRAA